MRSKLLASWCVETQITSRHTCISRGFIAKQAKSRMHDRRLRKCCGSTRLTGFRWQAAFTFLPMKAANRVSLKPCGARGYQNDQARSDEECFKNATYLMANGRNMRP